MNEPLSKDQLLTLVDAACSGAIEESQLLALDARLADDSDACETYVDYCEFFTELYWMMRRSQCAEPVDLSAKLLPPAINVAETRSAPTAQRERASRPVLFPVGSLATGLDGTFGYFSSGWPVAYLLATVIFGLGLVIGALVPVSQPAQMATRTSLPGGSWAEPKMELVGRITGMVDCRWAENPKSEIRNPKQIRSYKSESINPGSLVALGDTFALASGLMEITYDTGAKVILQGPVTYEAESNGGYLSIGRLTGKLETKTQDPRPKTSDPSSLIPHPLFVVRTPTATVTDLGTEFGVEVDKDGGCEVHVLQGRVKTARTSATGVQGAELLLSANQAIRLDPVQAKYTVIAAEPGRFKDMQARLVRPQRLRWPILDKTLVAWVLLANTEQRGVSPLSLVNMPQWDGIVLGELAPGKWMAGSHGYARTQKEQSHYSSETAGPGELVEIAIVYGAPNISIYRNGQKYAEFPLLDQITFDEKSILLMGKRHPWNRNQTSPLPTLVGAIEEARFYDRALSAEMVGALRPNEPSTLAPVGWWTFEDGTARDSTGHFPMGELHGNARIAGGKLILDGADSYLVIPAAKRPEEQPATEMKNKSSGRNRSQTSESVY